ncbi:hypothetical protein ON011_003283 [Providencia rettgeri]|nr:hypothetical protein [Providencia rettgeri]
MDAKQLQQSLVPGDLIIATENAYFENGKISQTKGDILMVNNPRIGDLLVGGTGLNGVAYNGRKCLGLCGSFRVGTFRRATPEDKGYMATREQWSDWKDKKISQLQRLNITLSIIIAVLVFLVSIYY